LTYHNTTDVAGDTLTHYRRSAQTQNDTILSLFQIHRRLSPSQVSDHTDHHWPLTSIRRAISDLTKEGRLQKTEVKVRGRYGKPEHVWQLIELLDYKPPKVPRWDEKGFYDSGFGRKARWNQYKKHS